MIFRFFYTMLPFMAAALPFTVLWRFKKTRRESALSFATNRRHEAGVIVFVLLLVGVASQAIIPAYTWTEQGVHFAIWKGPITERLNIIPFHFIKVMKAALKMGDIQYFLINIIGNLAIFAPIGFLVPLLWPKWTLTKVMLLGFLCSLTIELVQLPQDRWSDIDDIILNTMGALAGYVIYFLLNKAAPRLTDSFKVTKSDMEK